jgi:hypothetical protein
MNNPSSNPRERKCEYCGFGRMYLATARDGTSYPKWNNKPLKEHSWIYEKCIQVKSVIKLENNDKYAINYSQS